MARFTISLAKSGGISVREHFKVDDLDQSADAVTVKVPEYLNAISPSFFLGLFSESIAKLGGREQFLKKYQFIADSVILEQVNNGIKRAIALRGQLQK